MRTVGFMLVAVILSTAHTLLTQALVNVGLLSGTTASRDGGIVAMMLYLFMHLWFREEEKS